MVNEVANEAVNETAMHGGCRGCLWGWGVGSLLILVLHRHRGGALCIRHGTKEMVNPVFLPTILVA